jgi:hypothetical protein
MTIRRLCSAALLAVAAVLPAAEPVIEPQAAVQGWIAAVQRGDLAALPSLGTEQRSPAAPVGAGDPGAARPRPQRSALSMMLDGPMRMLPEEQLAGQGGRLLAIALAQMAATVGPAGSAAPPQPAMPEDGNPFLSYGPLLLGSMLPATAVSGILASGLETRQLAALDALGVAFHAWAKDGVLADEVRAAAAAPMVAQALTALRQPRPAPGQEPAPFDQAAAWKTAWPLLVRACAIYGLDGEAVLASAAVALESRADDGTAVVVLAFTAFGSQHLVPLKLKLVDGTWSPVADSPAVRWGRGGGVGGRMSGVRGGMNPGRGRGRDRGPGQRGDGAPAQPPVEAPAQPPSEF